MKRIEKDRIERREEHLNEYIGELKDRQRNTIWPDTLRNSRGVDSLLWKGNENAPPVQRIGIAILGLLFLAVGLDNILIGKEQQSWVAAIFGSFLALVSLRLFRNALRGVAKKRKK